MSAPYPSRLQTFPISWFAMVMGLSGFTLAWHRAEVVFALPAVTSAGLLLLTIAVFVTLLTCYGLKLLRFPALVKAELAHPVKLNFFPALSIALILLGTALLPYDAYISLACWSVGATLHLGFTLFVLSNWMHQTHFEITHISPAWFIPVVGNILVPIAGVQHASAEVSWFFFSIGLVFWLVLLTIIFYRMFFHHPLPTRLLPTLFILIAPPAVGFVSWLQLTGEVNAFARILYYSALFLTLLLLTQAGRFLKLPFFLSWWAYSFPMAAVTIATLLMYQQLQLGFFKWLGAGLLGLLTLIILTLLVKTLIAVIRRDSAVED
ncbi:MAG: SLAC1 anion channel family protein [Gammaproteobacteria bacterium]